MDRYTDALCKEIKKWGGLYDRPFDTVYFGGGTPSLLGTRIADILECVNDSFGLVGDPEITAEVNPSSASTEFLNIARSAGVNRLSIGVQSGNDLMLKKLGRLHTAADAVETVENARRIGFDNISLDLMIALPDSNEYSLKADLDFITALESEHVSAYMLKLEENTPLFSKKDIALPDDDGAAWQYQLMCEHLKNAGFEHYEISNFAKKGRRSRHNLKYWQMCDYLGIGPSAHSFINSKRFYYPRDIYSFLEDANTVPDGNGGDIEEQIMLALRLSDGFDFADYPHLAEFLKKLEMAGFGVLNKSVFSLTSSGMAVSNAVISEILEMI